MPLLGSLAAGSVKGFGAQANLGYFIGQSLRFRESASAYLTRTFTTPTNNKIWTFSVWLKRGKVDSYDGIFSSAVAGTGYSTIRIDSTGYFDFVQFDGTTNLVRMTSNRLLRDPAAWYHLVVSVDTTQATSSNRVKMYVNGEQITSFLYSDYPSQNFNTYFNAATSHNVGRNVYSGSTDQPFDGYIGDVYLVDGQALTPSYFGKTDPSTGQWIPKKYSGTYGTNGFYLNFSDGTSTTTLGYDYSGNSNNWTTNNISLTAGTTYDLMNDVPTLTSMDKGNFATLNPLSETSTLSTSEANLAVANSTTEAQHRLIRGTMGMSTGKWYWEVNVNNSSNVDMVGIITSGYNGSDNVTVNAGGTTGHGFGYGYSTANGNWYGTTGWTNDGVTPSPFPSSGIIGVAFDADNKKLYFSRNNTWINSANPSAGTGANATYSGSETEFLPALSIYNNTGTWRVNFGQRPFAYTPPTGYKKLNTYNL